MVPDAFGKILDIARDELGYGGYKDGKFIFRGAVLSEREARGKVRSWFGANGHGGDELLAYKLNDKKVGDSLISGALMSFSLPEDTPAEGDPSNMGGVGLHAVYSAINVVPEYVADAHGNSLSDVPLVIANLETKRLMSMAEYSPQAFFSDYKISRKEVATSPLLRKSKLVFEPYRADFSWSQIDEFYSTEVEHLNIYNPPKWRKICGAIEAKIPENISILLHNLFPIDSEREWVLKWMKCAILDRNHTYLVLFGGKGIGKTMVASLLSCLVGTEYYTLIDESIFSDKFTSSIYRKRLAFLDEAGLAEKSASGGFNIKEGVKRLMNSRIKVESKGQNPFMAPNFCTFLMALNKDTDLGVDPDDRRFSIPEVGERSLREVLPVSVLSRWDKEWNQGITSEESLFELAAFGKYLLELDYGTWSPAEPLKGDAFYAATSRSMFSWKRALLKKIMEEAEPGWSLPLPAVKGIKDDFGNRIKAQESSITKFFDSYRHMGLKVAEITERVDKITGSSGKSEFKQIKSIVPTPEFIQKFCYKQTMAENNEAEIL